MKIQKFLFFIYFLIFSPKLIKNYAELFNELKKPEISSESKRLVQRLEFLKVIK